ncbi:MAG: PQQ-like beta-propeller repeat protein [Thermoleophilaceae bacterium]|nr:PQQ-like beta-propeller repeat protein [Thermoleophilaceae bacterium]
MSGGPFLPSNTRRRRRRWPLVVLILVLLALAGGGAAYLLVGRSPDDVSNEDVEFKGGQEEKVSSTPIFAWPTFGYTPARTRYLNRQLQYPLKRTWSFGGSKLIEFPPVLANRRLFFVKNNGEAYSLSAPTGRVLWRKRIGRLGAASPSWDKGTLYATSLEPGRVLALDAVTSRIKWRKRLPSRTESSPLVVGRRVFLGSEDGTVYALSAKTGRQLWTYRASGAVKAALAFSGGKLYFGDYGDQFHAIRAKTGKKVWSKGGIGRSLGRGGRFYSSPAVAFGRVYVGNYDGRVYSFSASDGDIAWTRATGGYVLAAPAVANVPGTKPSVYIGSSSGRFFALDARSGRTRWSKDFGGRILGSASIVEDIAYFSNIDRKSTLGLDVRDGRRRFSFGRGGYTPVISDGRRLFLTGYSSLYAFDGKEVRSSRSR